MKISVAKREYLVEIEVRKFTPRTINELFPIGCKFANTPV